jgi:hypothetical protein
VLGHLSSSSDLNQFPVDEDGDGHLHEAGFPPPNFHHFRGR